MAHLKRGTRVEIEVRWPGALPEQATIVGYAKDSHVSGYYRVRYARDGARLCVHESNFRVVDNRP